MKQLLIIIMAAGLSAQTVVLPPGFAPDWTGLPVLSAPSVDAVDPPPDEEWVTAAATECAEGETKIGEACTPYGVDLRVLTGAEDR